jgi:hypothetical protein
LGAVEDVEDVCGRVPSGHAHGMYAVSDFLSTTTNSFLA